MCLEAGGAAGAPRMVTARASAAAAGSEARAASIYRSNTIAVDNSVSSPPRNSSLNLPGGAPVSAASTTSSLSSSSFSSHQRAFVARSLSLPSASQPSPRSPRRSLVLSGTDRDDVAVHVAAYNTMSTQLSNLSPRSRVSVRIIKPAEVEKQADDVESPHASVPGSSSLASSASGSGGEEVGRGRSVSPTRQPSRSISLHATQVK